MSAEFIEADDKFSHESVPSREEFEAITDHAVLWRMMDDYERAIIRIETCLQYPGSFDRDWFFRARSALIMFRIGLRQADKRAKAIEKGRPGPSLVAIAPAA